MARPTHEDIRMYVQQRELTASRKDQICWYVSEYGAVTALTMSHMCAAGSRRLRPSSRGEGGRAWPRAEVGGAARMLCIVIRRCNLHGELGVARPGVRPPTDPPGVDAPTERPGVDAPTE
eukprot:CAMPEP_0174758906 /NCGR_PEP_ID=MMETSP1094-20130205/108001_1 /TAXON_ID=156173 /ORGANISM="Chrysochromulina brevifilum, Strain UTEX LB 985" /LENGTH=119 /DNA_ID=CAMNT_0015964837 /DNA_START=218 /DNA_END=577 /DNA_ORIENTATION=+